MGRHRERLGYAVPSLPDMQLSPEAVRVLGCLIEKQMTTPDYYPMTVNALVAAANQSTNREPVVDYDMTTVTQALTEMQDVGAVRAVHGPGQRAVKYRHVLDETLGIGGADTALLAVLMLRGEQTPGELRTRTTRYHEFSDPAEVAARLADLAGRHEPLVAQLERQPGEKESRWRHLLAIAPVALPGAMTDAALPEPGAATTPLEDELIALRSQVEALAARLDRLEALLDR